MNLIKRISILLLFIIPIWSMFYKNYIAKIDLIPSSATGKWNLSVDYPLAKIREKLGEKYLVDKEVVKLPFSNSTALQDIRSFSLLDGSKPHFIDDKAIHFFEIPRSEFEEKDKLTLLLNVELLHEPQARPLKTRKLVTEDQAYLNELLSLDMLSEIEIEQLKLLNTKIITFDEEKIDIAKKIYAFIVEEFTLDEGINNLTEALTHSAGSKLIKAQLLAYLNKLNGIPSRINVAYEMNKGGQVSLAKQIFIPEILLDNHWFMVTTDLSPFNQKIEDFFVLYNNYDDYPSLFKRNFITIRSVPIMVNKVDSVLYRNKLKSSSSILSLLSLHNLPVNIRSVFYTVLLIPLGTLVLAFSRVLLGIKSFGIFTPILLSLFFLETSLGTGITFFGIIVLLGFGQRYLLDRLYLLAIPRLSILLTLVIISYTLFSLTIYQNNNIFQVRQSLNYLPIVIITGFIERFSIHFIEEGMVNTIKALIGTLTIAILCYIIFKINFLRQILFNNPELLLMIIGLNLMIGSYKGYRLNEVLRFKEFEGINEDV